MDSLILEDDIWEKMEIENHFIKKITMFLNKTKCGFVLFI